MEKGRAVPPARACVHRNVDGGMDTGSARPRHLELSPCPIQQRRAARLFCGVGSARVQAAVGGRLLAPHECGARCFQYAGTGRRRGAAAARGGAARMCDCRQHLRIGIASGRSPRAGGGGVQRAQRSSILLHEHRAGPPGSARHFARRTPRAAYRCQRVRNDDAPRCDARAAGWPDSPLRDSPRLMSATSIVDKRWWIIAAWVVIGLLVAPSAARVEDRLAVAASVPGSESARVQILLSSRFPAAFPTYAVVVVTGGPSPVTPDGKAVLVALKEKLSHLDIVSRTLSYLDAPDSGFVGAHGETYIVVGLETRHRRPEQVVPLLRNATADLATRLRTRYPT